MNDLISLVETISTHEAVNNSFYKIWTIEKLSLSQIAVFARNYWEWTYRFPEALAALIMNIENILARAEYTKTLFSEMGNGEAKRVHSVLFEDFCVALSAQLGNADYLTLNNLKKNFSLLSETNSLNRCEKELYSQSYSVAVGAQLALEWQAYTMIRQLYEGARNYMHLWDNPDKFHEACEFFYVHIGSAEKEHKEESIFGANKIIEDGGKFSEIEYGFKKHLDLIADFWNAIATEISSLRGLNNSSLERTVIS